ncbi:MAG: aromatic ring-hydroxylating dioxygenase subunit alpha [Chloroflexi bacterium]|nr:aromatic ring-hydroxylating dioxygenase subunit alpha [Chloroflexota bacterium]
MRNQWYVVLESSEVRRKPVGVTRLGEKLVFWRDSQGAVHCLFDQCCHRGAALSAGHCAGDRIVCPFHGFQYDATGRCRAIPANSLGAAVPDRYRVDGYPTHEAHGLIWIYWGATEPPLSAPRFLDDLDDSFAWASVHDPWAAHYSRVLENQLDVLHLPWVHANSIGRGGRYVVDGPGVQWVDEALMRVYVHNRTEDGRLPLKPDELPMSAAGDYRLELLLPNLWQNRISPDARVMAAFVPVDDKHTLLYLRFYQRFVRLPGLRKLVAWAAMPFNRYIAHQDRRVVETQRPRASGLGLGERLVQGDRPVLEYRLRRDALIKRANKQEV